MTHFLRDFEGCQLLPVQLLILYMIEHFLKNLKQIFTCKDLGLRGAESYAEHTDVFCSFYDRLKRSPASKFKEKIMKAIASARLGEKKHKHGYVFYVELRGDSVTMKVV